MLKLFLCLALSSLFLVGCGTIIQGRYQEIGISSNPKGSKVSVHFKDVSPHLKKDASKMETECISPCSLTLLRRIQTYEVSFEKENFEPASAIIYRRPSGWLWGNIFFGGIFGLMIDLGEGGGYKLKPFSIHVDLNKNTTK